AITTLESSMSDREQNYNRRLSATEGLDAQEKQGRLVLSVLDKLLQPALLDNDSLKRGWEGARQIRRRPGPGAATPTAPTTPGAHNGHLYKEGSGAETGRRRAQCADGAHHAAPREESGQGARDPRGCLRVFDVPSHRARLRRGDAAAGVARRSGRLARRDARD